MKKKKIIIYLIALWIVIGSILVYNNPLNNNNLDQIGYNTSQIEQIKNLCSKEEISIIKNNKYNDAIINIITNPDYQVTKLAYYLDYYQPNMPIDDLILIVNNGANSYEYNEIQDFIHDKNFKIENINKYMSYQGISDSATIIVLVNNDYDYDSDTINQFVNEKYYISDNIIRYLNYFNDNKNLNTKEIVTRVNANLDYPFYEHTEKANYDDKLLILVNKYYYLDKDYTPDNLVYVGAEYTKINCQLNETAYQAYIKMSEQANSEDMHFYIRSAYRNYQDQAYIYNSYIKEDGQEVADKYSARAGFSEHQTGLAVDLAVGTGEFGIFANTKEAKWLQENSYKFGFILRYPKDKTNITGYTYESWHFRYVGKEAAKIIYDENLTYEEYYAYYVNK